MSISNINWKAQATALVLLASTPAAMANPLAGIMGTEGACDSIEVSVDSSSSYENESIVDNDSILDDILGYDHTNDYTETYKSGKKANSASGASRNCREAREWFSEERKRDRKHQFQSNLMSTGVNLLGGLFQHAQNRKAAKEQQAQEARANRQLQQQAQQIEILRQELQAQRQHQQTMAPVYPSINASYPARNNYQSTQTRSNLTPTANTYTPTTYRNPHPQQYPQPYPNQVSSY